MVLVSADYTALLPCVSAKPDISKLNKKLAIASYSFLPVLAVIIVVSDHARLFYLEHITVDVDPNAKAHHP